jgi:hypothetical protein
MNFGTRLVIGASAALTLAIAGGAVRAATTSAPTAALDPAPLPPLPPLPVPPNLADPLAPPRFELPPLDPEADIEACAVCRLATATTGQIPADAFRIEGTLVEHGATLRLLSSDAAVRDALWQATLARGCVLAALRAEISARRIPEGVMLVYTSPSPEVVRQIQTAVRAGSDVPL